MSIIINTLAITIKALDNNIIKAEPVRGTPFYALNKEEFVKEFTARYHKEDLLFKKVMKAMDDYYGL